MAKIITPVFRLSYPSLFETSTFGDGGPKYSCSAIWDPSMFSAKDKQRWTEMQKAMNELSIAAFKKPLKELPANIKRGIRNGNEKPDDAAYGEGTFFASLTSKHKPGIVDSQRVEITDADRDQIYPGCYVRATVVPFSYDNQSKGIALGLQNIQKVAEGERLDGRTSANEDFADDVDEEWLNDGYDFEVQDEIPF